MTFTDRDLRNQLATAIQDHGDDFDVDGIVDEIRSTYGIVDVDTIPADDFWALVQRHDRTADQS